MTPSSTASRPPRLPLPRCERLPARACGRRLHHTRRYVTSLILLARAFDAEALDRLRHRARQPGNAGLMGLVELTITLIQPPPDTRLPLMP